MTAEKIQMFEKNSHIPDEKVEVDIKETEQELINVKEDLENVLKTNPNHHLTIYSLEATIAQGEDFISNLKEMLEYRKTIKNQQSDDI